MICNAIVFVCLFLIFEEFFLKFYVTATLLWQCVELKDLLVEKDLHYTSIGVEPDAP
jgi:hypothetical protein